MRLLQSENKDWLLSWCLFGNFLLWYWVLRSPSQHVHTTVYCVVGVVYEHLTRTIGDCILFEVFGGVMISGALITSVRQVGR